MWLGTAPLPTLVVAQCASYTNSNIRSEPLLAKKMAHSSI